MNADFMIRRKQFYEKIPDFWPNLNGHEYALYEHYPISQSVVEDVRSATSRVYQILTTFSNRVQQLSEEDWTQVMLQLGYPPPTVDWLRVNNLPWPSVIARADWALTSEGPKLLEWNSDTPSFIKELFDVNGKVCCHFGVPDPNASEALRLANALKECIRLSADWLGCSDPRIVISGYPDDEEDVSTNRYLAQFIRKAGFEVSEIPLRDLQIDSEGIYDQQGNAFQIWFRPGYPVEFLAEERDPFHHLSLGEMVGSLIRQKRLAMINPFTAFIHQNKRLQALIWASRDETWLSTEMREWIHRYWLPSSDVADLFREHRLAYVDKPAFGREGGGVRIYNDQQQLIAADDQAMIDEQSRLFQKYVALPQQIVQTERGTELCSLLLGCFCIAGQGSAIGFRAGGIITDNRSYYLPTSLKG